LRPPKVYFFDNGDVVGDEGARFENLVATHLLKRIQFLEDRDGFRYELRYIRDKEGREVDFAVLKDGEVDMLVEAKWTDDTPDRGIAYFAERVGARRAVQVVAKLRHAYTRGKLEIVPPRALFDEGPWASA
jgi:predicted AAA+ superfamily ATPase